MEFKRGDVGGVNNRIRSRGAGQSLTTAFAEASNCRCGAKRWPTREVLASSTLQPSRFATAPAKKSESRAPSPITGRYTAAEPIYDCALRLAPTAVPQLHVHAGEISWNRPFFFLQEYTISYQAFKIFQAREIGRYAVEIVACLPLDKLLGYVYSKTLTL